MARDGARSGGGGSRRGVSGPGGDFLHLVLDYAKQETLGPAKGLARFVAFGVVGSIALSVGVVVLLVALLRALQNETGATFSGKLSWLPYVITAGAAVLVAGWLDGASQEVPLRRRRGRREEERWWRRPLRSHETTSRRSCVRSRADSTTPCSRPSRSS